MSDSIEGWGGSVASGVGAIGAAGFEGHALPTTPNSALLADADALVLVSAAAGGKGGVEPSELKAWMACVPDGLMRLVYVSVLGVERVDRLPYSMQNVFGQLDKLRAAEQVCARVRVPALM